MTDPGPGWYTDPQDTRLVRWWDGLNWSEKTQVRAPRPETAAQSPADQFGAVPYVPMATYSPRSETDAPLTHKEKDRQTRKNNSLGYTGTVLSLLAFLLNPFAVLSILGIVFSSIGLAKSHQLAQAGYKVTGHGTSIAGIILGVVGLAAFAWRMSQLF